jgi:hypothetical protein
MKPTIGRIVIFHCDENQKEKWNNSQSDAPAVITSVWSDTCVNLKVLLDGDSVLWVTSVPEGTGSANWSWPTIN